LPIWANRKIHMYFYLFIFKIRQLVRGEHMTKKKFLLGIQTITKSEIYANMNFERVAYDFPTIAVFNQKPEKGKGDTPLGDRESH